MSHLISVYYPTRQERDAMKEAVAIERKLLKEMGVKLPSDRGLNHGGHLMNLGRWWKLHQGVQEAYRKWLVAQNPGIGSQGKALPVTGEVLKKRALNAKRGHTGK